MMQSAASRGWWTRYLATGILLFPLLKLYESQIRDPLAWPAGIVLTVAFALGSAWVTYSIVDRTLRLWARRSRDRKRDVTLRDAD